MAGDAKFGLRLENLMMARGWRQSELARQAGIPRNSISVYIRGASLPTALNLQKLAEALDVSSEELLPKHKEPREEERQGSDDSPFIMRSVPDSPGKVWISVNRPVSMATGVKIFELFNADESKAIQAKS